MTTRRLDPSCATTHEPARLRRAGRNLATVFVLATSACSSSSPPAETSSADTPMSDDKASSPPPSTGDVDPHWPATPSAAWPAACTISDVGVHPTLPWLTLACSKNDFGAIMVIDVQSGSLVSVSTSDETTGWANEGLVLWDSSGTRLCTNADTGGIAVLESAAFAGLNHPTEARDGPTHYAWVDHRIYTDTNNLFDPKHAEGWARFKFPPSRKILWTVGGFRWNANINAVVGRVDDTEEAINGTRRLVAYDPVRDTTLYDRPAGDVAGLQWSDDARWILTSERRPRGGPTQVLLIDGNDGKETRRFEPKYGTAGRMSVSAKGDIVVGSSERPAPTESVVRTTQLWRLGKPPIDLAVGEKLGVAIAWAPDAAGFAWLDKQGTVTIFDATSGRATTSFSVPEPMTHADLLWVSPARIVIVGPQHVSIYGLDGSRVAKLAAPD